MSDDIFGIKPAYYSPSAAEMFGTITYRTTDGREVECTLIGSPGEWPDIVKVGDVNFPDGLVRMSEKWRNRCAMDRGLDWRLM